MKLTRSVLAFTVAACSPGSRPSREPDQDFCRRLHTTADARLVAHAADRPRIEQAYRASGVSMPGDVQLGLLRPVYDLNATYDVAVRIGTPCLSARDESPCAGVLGLHPPELGGLDGAFDRVRDLVRGLAGEGPCARMESQPSPATSVPSCARLASELHVADAALDRALRGWPLALDVQGLPGVDVHETARSMSRWRALIDYGVSALPACAPPAVARTCIVLRRDLQALDPRELVARVRLLEAAFARRTPCPS